MTTRDPELRALLVEELERHAATLARPGLEEAEVHRVLHAVKGTAGVAGESALSDAFARMLRHSGEPWVVAHAVRLLSSAVEHLRADRPAYTDPWPVPPDELRASAPAGSLAAQYRAEMRARTDVLSTVLDAPEPQSALSEALRHVHAMKGAAAAVGDEVTAWFCHGLEGRIRAARQDEAEAGPMIDQLGQWRAVLRGLVDDTEGTLEVLRAAGGRGRETPGARRPSQPPCSEPDQEAWLQVPTQALDLVLERLRRMSQAAREVQNQGETVRRSARALRSARQRLLEARRLIGPARPWGAPVAALDGIESAAHAVGAAAAQLEAIASASRQRATVLGQSASASQAELGTLRRATMSLVFVRVRDALEAMTSRSECEVRLEESGASTPVDRRLAEALVDPVLQLVRNAVAHGIESPSLRRAVGKPPWGRIVLSAEIRGAHLLVGVQDDGAGVDVDALRADAVRSGQLASDAARDGADESVLNLLFRPGVTTRTTADLLAGRGLGLDIALQAARRLGGTIRIRNRPGHGLTAEIDVPLVERGPVRVLWVRSLGNRFALTARYVLRVYAQRDGTSRPPALATWIDPRSVGNEPGPVMDIGRSQEDRVVSVSVGALECIEEATVRPVPPLVALAGPYVGIIVGADGKPSLLVDALLVSDRATFAQRGRGSSFPPPARDQR